MSAVETREPFAGGGAPDGREPLLPVRCVRKDAEGFVDRALASFGTVVDPEPIVQEEPDDLDLGYPSIVRIGSNLPLLLFRDVDLGPLHTAAIYICSESPTEPLGPAFGTGPLRLNPDDRAGCPAHLGKFVPFIVHVNEHIRWDRKRSCVEGTPSFDEGLVGALQDDYQVDVASYAPITAGIGAGVADPAHVR